MHPSLPLYTAGILQKAKDPCDSRELEFQFQPVWRLQEPLVLVELLLIFHLWLIVAINYLSRELFFPTKINKPIHNTNHNSTTNDVSNCYREQILHKEVSPGQIWEILCGFSNRFKEFGISTGFNKQGDRDEIHIRDTVFKSGCHETRDRVG